MHILKRAHCGSFFKCKNQFTLELESFENKNHIHFGFHFSGNLIRCQYIAKILFHVRLKCNAFFFSIVEWQTL